MIIDVNDAPTMALKRLKEKLHQWRDTASPIWPSTWPVFERLIDRHDEMAPVYREMVPFNITDPQLWIFLELLIHAGSFGTEKRHADLRADYLKLTRLNEEINVTSLRLAEMLERRSELLNRSGYFYCDRMTGLTELMDNAGEGNGLYQLYLQPELQSLKRYDLKYWPAIADILRAMAMENAEVGFADEATEAIIKARRPSRTDFFRELFNRIDEHKTGHWYALPRTLKLSDAALATICNITRDLPPDEIIDAAYVKRTRHRLKEQGFSAVW